MAQRSGQRRERAGRAGVGQEAMKIISARGVLSQTGEKTEVGTLFPTLSQKNALPKSPPPPVLILYNIYRYSNNNRGLGVLQGTAGGKNTEIISANFGTRDFSNFEIISGGCPDIAPILFACRRSRKGLGWKT